jgi:hypothetical protein
MVHFLSRCRFCIYVKWVVSSIGFVRLPQNFSVFGWNKTFLVLNLIFLFLHHQTELLILNNAKIVPLTAMITMWLKYDSSLSLIVPVSAIA